MKRTNSLLALLFLSTLLILIMVGYLTVQTASDLSASSPDVVTEIVVHTQIVKETVVVLGTPPHLQVPKIELYASYEDTREFILDSGWEPTNNYYSDNIDNYFLGLGYYENISCSGTGFGFCRFEFFDVYNNRLVVITAGGVEDPLIWQFWMDFKADLAD